MKKKGFTQLRLLKEFHIYYYFYKLKLNDSEMI